MGGLSEKLARANELVQLRNEALDANQVHVADACDSLRKRLLIGAPLGREDIGLVEGFIGRRYTQDRYGR
jgi:hypothetical protein